MTRAAPAEEPRLSDHALVRYMERGLGMDLDPLRDELLTPERRIAIAMGAARIHLLDQRLTLIVQGRVITTVVPLQRLSTALIQPRGH